MPLAIENAIAGPVAQSAAANFFGSAGAGARSSSNLASLSDLELSSPANSNPEESSADSATAATQNQTSGTARTNVQKLNNRSAISGAGSGNSANSQSVFNNMLCALLPPAPVAQAQEPASVSAVITATEVDPGDMTQSSGAATTLAQAGVVIPHAASQLTANILPVSLPSSGAGELPSEPVFDSNSQNASSAPSIAATTASGTLDGSFPPARIASSTFSGTISGSTPGFSSLGNLRNDSGTSVSTTPADRTLSNIGAPAGAAAPTNSAETVGDDPVGIDPPSADQINTDQNNANQFAADRSVADPPQPGQSPAGLAATAYAVGSSSAGIMQTAALKTEADSLPPAGADAMQPQLNPSSMDPANAKSTNAASSASGADNAASANSSPEDSDSTNPVSSNPAFAAAATTDSEYNAQISPAAITAKATLANETQPIETSVTAAGPLATAKPQATAASRPPSASAAARFKPIPTTESLDLASADTNAPTQPSDLRRSDATLEASARTSADFAPNLSTASLNGNTPPNPAASAAISLKNNPAVSPSAVSTSLNASPSQSTSSTDTPSSSTDGSGPDSSTRKISAATTDAPAFNQAIALSVAAQSAVTAGTTAGLALSAASQAASASPGKANAEAPAAANTPQPSTNESATSAAASPGPVQMAQIVDKAAQSEMRIGLNTTAFGSVEVHTVVHANDVGISIGTERGDLHGLLVQELPGIAHTLQQENLRLGQVNVHQGLASSNGMTSGGNSQSRSFASKPQPMAGFSDLALTDEAGAQSGGETAAAQYSNGRFSILA